MNFSKYLRRLNAVDRLLLIYILFTALFIAVFNDQIQPAGFHLLMRLVMVGGVFCLPLLDRFMVMPVVQFFRVGYPLLLLGFFYSETDALNNIFFDNLDQRFARFDALLFGCQPSLEFYRHFPSKWISELMNFGYFSYYFLILGFSIHIFLKSRELFVRTVFIITCSFLLYYIIFMMVPVSGPQYFFDFPHNKIADSGLFRTLVKFVEAIGERPTAAFPSSHVGIVLILIFLAWPNHTGTYFWLIPVFFLLTLSTVYVKAHYAVDVLGGLISAPIIWWTSIYVWKLFNSHKI